MKKEFKKNFPMLIAKDASIFVGVVCWLLLFVNIYSENYTFFSVSNIISNLNSLSFMFGSYLNTFIGLFYGLIILIVVLSGLIIGFSFAKGKARNITSIICASFLLIVAIAFVCLVNGYGRYYYVTSGYGSYIFIVSCIAVIVISAIDLHHMTSAVTYNDDHLPFVDSTNDPPTIITSQKGTIECISGEYSSYKFPINEGEALLIGKNPGACAIVITQQSQYISAVHCSVRLNNGIYEIYDQSKNGVRVNGNLITKNCWHRLEKGNVFSLGETDNIFKIL